MSDRFWEKVDIRGEDECWLWMASLHKDGYGNFRGSLAHIVSWKITNGDIPKGMYVCHKCDNRACANPKHLFLGTQLDNMRDMILKGRGYDHSGENNPKAKLREKDVLEIYRLHNSGFSNADIARNYGVTKTAINYIVKGKSWHYIWEKENFI